MKILLTNLFLLLLLSTKLFSCATSNAQTYLKNEYYNFTDPDMIDLPRDNPLYKLSGSYAAHDARFSYFSQKKKEANIQAWKSYFNDVYTTKEIEAFFYKKASIKKSAKYYKHSKIYPSFGKYINFLDLQNNIAQNNEHNNSAEVINKGLALFKAETEPFIKERYLYLLMRLYHHTGQHEKLLDLYANNVLIINQQGIVQEWITALRAGAYQQLKQPSKANILYAKMFKNHQTNPHYGYYDFKITSNKEWRELLSSTEENNTKALYHFLRAMQWENEPLHELKNIANLAEESVWFERLSYMIMQDLQYKRHDIMVHTGKKSKYFYAKLKSYKLQKKYFLNILSKLKKQTFFSLYSKLYLNVLEFNSLQRKELVQLRTLANNKQKPYAKLLNYIYGLHQLSSSSKEDQMLLYAQLQPLLKKFSSKKQASILRYTILQISMLNEEGSIEKELNQLFSKNEMYRESILKSLNYADASKFKKYVETKKDTFFKEKVFKESMNNLNKGDVAKILATLYLQENNFQKSQFYLRQVPKENVFSPYNPFNVSLSANNRKKSKQSYSQRKFVETMLRIESALAKNPHSAKDHFLYANGLYNKSWFGNFPMSSVLYRNPYLARERSYPKTMDLSQARAEYELALKYTKDEEFKAKIAYQLLKIQFNIALYNKENDTENLETKNLINLLKKSKDFSEAIRDFRSNYEHTNYAQEIIEHCITFKYF